MPDSTNPKDVAAFAKKVAQALALERAKAEAAQAGADIADDVGTLSGPRARQTPDAYRPASSGRYGRPERQETPEERTERFRQKAGVPVTSQVRPPHSNSDAEDDAEEAAFMGRPAIRQMTPEQFKEELQKRVWDAKESAHEQAVFAKQQADHEGAMYADARDQELIAKNNARKGVPQFITDWSNQRIQNRGLQSEADRAERATHYRNDDQAWQDRAHRMDGYVPGFAQSFVNTAKGYVTPRQPQTFQRETSDGASDPAERDYDEDLRKAIETAKKAK